jgi:hypothetical protein
VEAVEAAVEAAAVAVRDIGGSVRRAAVDQDQLEKSLQVCQATLSRQAGGGRRHVTVLIDTQVG